MPFLETKRIILDGMRMSNKEDARLTCIQVKMHDTNRKKYVLDLI